MYVYIYIISLPMMATQIEFLNSDPAASTRTFLGFVLALQKRLKNLSKLQRSGCQRSSKARSHSTNMDLEFFKIAPMLKIPSSLSTSSILGLQNSD